MAANKSEESENGGFAWVSDKSGAYREPLDPRGEYEGREMTMAIRTLSKGDSVFVDGDWMEVTETDGDRFSAVSESEGSEHHIHLLSSAHGLPKTSNTACVREGSGMGGDFIALIDSIEVDWS